MTPRELAWNDIEYRLPDGWHVGPPPTIWALGSGPCRLGRLDARSSVTAGGDHRVRRARAGSPTHLVIRLR
jgi:hypothetical protein